jgi:hypothetical protein
MFTGVNISYHKLICISSEQPVGKFSQMLNSIHTYIIYEEFLAYLSSLEPVQCSLHNVTRRLKARIVHC